jgi:hypothetical protein
MGTGESVWLQPSPSIWGATDEVESDAPKIEVDMAASQLLPCITGYICSHYLLHQKEFFDRILPFVLAETKTIFI